MDSERGTKESERYSGNWVHNWDLKRFQVGRNCPLREGIGKDIIDTYWYNIRYCYPVDVVA